MTYAAYETSTENGRPIELYLFQIGAESFRYTSAEGGYTWGGYLFTHKQVTRNAPVQSQEGRHELQITLPASDEVCARYTGVVPGQLMTAEITRVHQDDPDQEGWVIWTGKITGTAFQKRGTVCRMRGLTSETKTQHAIPRRKFQGPCNHVLYDARCGLLAASHKYEGVVSGVSGLTVTVAGLSVKGDDWATGGYVSLSSNDQRLILDQTGNVLTLMLAFPEDATGETVTVYAGCDHSLAVCNTKFSNSVNFGGFPYVPKRNPFVSGID